MTKITDVRPIDFDDIAAIAEAIDAFAKKYAYADVEYALEISPNGNMHSSNIFLAIPLKHHGIMQKMMLMKNIGTMKQP